MSAPSTTSLTAIGNMILKAEFRMNKLTEERDRQIREAAAAGMSLREIGRAVGMSAEGVRKVVAR